MARAVIWVAASLLLLTLAGCGGTDSSGPSSEIGGELLVSAAASLTDGLIGIETAFETAYPDVDVVLNFAGSSALREQILEGAPADVFASANMANMQQLVDAGEVAGEPVIFAANSLEIAVPAGNPAGVTGLEDFGRGDLLIGLCAEAVPCGDFARSVLRSAGVTPAIDTNEPDVRALLTKVELGELDAGITYVTDIAAADGLVDGVPIPDDGNIVAEYPIAALANAPNRTAADAFVRFVLSAEGRTILTDHGFAVP